MQLIVVRKVKDPNADGAPGPLRYALSTAPLRDVILEGLRHLWCCRSTGEPAERMEWATPEQSLWALPADWRAGLSAAPGPAVFYEASLSMEARDGNGREASPWRVIANGRFAAHVNHALLERLLDAAQADCLAVMAAADLQVCHERLRLTPNHQIAGYRRLYADSMAPIPLPGDWPHLLFVRRGAFDAVLKGDLLSRFDEWAGRCRAAGLRLQGMAVAGSAYDLESPAGLLAVAKAGLSCAGRADAARRPAHGPSESQGGEDGEISPDSHRIGPVRLGRRVTIEPGAVVVGPTVLCDGCTVGRDAVVDSAIVGTGVSIAPNRFLRGCVVTDSRPRPGAEPPAARRDPIPEEHVCTRDKGVFRTWPRFSYARCFKRIADVMAAILVLILFAPVIPILALAVKISAPGPVFFRDKRQGLQGRPFQCAKFRTMRQGADKMQDKLRYVSEVDGPQFKMADDPRITTVGRFLRETYLDEIPQFFNVLCGQMSVVGPRPSPEAENTLCPSWRDARLSVRPGITGLWQVHRTREPQKDFQEWILYDTQYVRDFSFGLDLWICWRTFQRMVGNFVSQF